jgi:osmotically inducible protein OsmC
MKMPSTHDQTRASDVLEGGATVVWNGDLKSGEGSLRFELGAGGELRLLWPGSDAYGAGATSPEELVAAAHAACLTMTLAHTLARSGHVPRKLTVEARSFFAVSENVRMISRSLLNITVDAAGLTEANLAEAAELAGRYCPVSNTLRAAGVALDVRAHLVAGTGSDSI